MLVQSRRWQVCETETVVVDPELFRSAWSDFMAPWRHPALAFCTVVLLIFAALMLLARYLGLLSPIRLH